MKRRLLCLLLLLPIGALGEEPGEMPVDGANEETPEEVGEVIFDAMEKGALFSPVEGDWRKFEEENGRNLIRLSGEPVVASRVEMGPYLRENELVMSANVMGKARKRLKPRMGLGLYGKNGFFLRLAPARGALELVQHGEILVETPYPWKSEEWHRLELAITVTEDRSRWTLEARAWPDGEDRPEEPVLVWPFRQEEQIFPLAGKAFLCGSPYNGLPIFFDEAVLRKAARP